MKILFTIAILFISVIGYAQGKINPKGQLDPTGPHTIANSKNIEGNIYNVQTLVERNAIPSNRRTIGFVCYVGDSSRNYQLQGGVLNANWVEFTAGGSGGTIIIDSAGVKPGKQSFTASAGQTDFTTSFTLPPDDRRIFIYRRGVKLLFTRVGNTLTINPCRVGDPILIESY